MTAWCPRISMRHTNTRHSTRSCIRSRSLLQKHDNHRRSNIQHMFPKLQQHLIWEVISVRHIQDVVKCLRSLTLTPVVVSPVYAVIEFIGVGKQS